MSFNAVRGIASSALAAAQVQMRLTSANIANADSEGYTRKTASNVTRMAGGTATGTALRPATSHVNRYLFASMTEAGTELAAAETERFYTDNLQLLFGSTDGSEGNSLASRVNALETALAQLAGTPESETLKALVVDALDTLAGEMRNLSGSIQELRAGADAEIEASVAGVNDALHQIRDLNEKILGMSALGQSTADLEDQRNLALRTVTTAMNARAYVDDQGQMRIYTASGVPLLDSAVHEIRYSAATAIGMGTSFDPILVDGRDIGGDISSGAIGALLAQRDQLLPDTLAHLNMFAKELVDRLNQVHPNLMDGTNAFNIKVNDAIRAAPATLETLTAGGTSIVDALRQAVTEDAPFAAAGRLADSQDSFAGYAGSIIADIAGLTSKAEVRFAHAESMHQTLKDAFLSQAGVNLDEETARLAELEQYYAAAAQLFQVVNQMFEALLDAARSA